MKILAIDPGFGRIGVAVLEKVNGKENLLYSDCITTSPQDAFVERLSVLGSSLEETIQYYTPDSLAIETLIFNTNQKTAMRVAEARGAIIYIATQNGLSVHEYTPLEVKTAVAGYGKASKEQVTAMVKRLISIKTTGKKLDDEYDAIAIGLTHFAVNK